MIHDTELIFEESLLHWFIQNLADQLSMVTVEIPPCCGRFAEEENANFAFNGVGTFGNKNLQDATRRSDLWEQIQHTPWQINQHGPQNGGSEDDFPFQLGYF